MKKQTNNLWYCQKQVAASLRLSLLWAAPALKQGHQAELPTDGHLK